MQSIEPNVLLFFVVPTTVGRICIIPRYRNKRKHEFVQPSAVGDEREEPKEPMASGG